MLDPKTRGDRYQVVVHVDEPALANPDQPGQSVLEQTRVPAETSQRIACDASKVVMWHAADGSVLDVGRKTRTVPPTIRRALEYRDKHCRFPWCGSKYCDAHHIRHWARGGETKLDNLSLLCVRHHRAVHEGGFRMVRTPLKQLEFYWPNGHLMPDAPSPPPIPGDPVSEIVARHGEEGIDIGGRTGIPSWDGEPMALDWAMAVLYDA